MVSRCFWNGGLAQIYASSAHEPTPAYVSASSFCSPVPLPVVLLGSAASEDQALWTLVLAMVSAVPEGLLVGRYFYLSPKRRCGSATIARIAGLQCHGVVVRASAAQGCRV